MKVETYTCYIEQGKMVDIPVRKLIHTDDVGRIAESMGYLEQHPEEREKYEQETIMPVDNAPTKENLFR